MNFDSYKVSTLDPADVRDGSARKPDTVNSSDRLLMEPPGALPIETVHRVIIVPEALARLRYTVQREGLRSPPRSAPEPRTRSPRGEVLLRVPCCLAKGLTPDHPRALESRAPGARPCPTTPLDARRDSAADRHPGLRARGDVECRRTRNPPDPWRRAAPHSRDHPCPRTTDAGRDPDSTVFA